MHPEIPANDQILAKCSLRAPPKYFERQKTAEGICLYQYQTASTSDLHKISANHQETQPTAEDVCFYRKQNKLPETFSQDARPELNLLPNVTPRNTPNPRTLADILSGWGNMCAANSRCFRAGFKELLSRSPVAKTQN